MTDPAKFETMTIDQDWFNRAWKELQASHKYFLTHCLSDRADRIAKLLGEFRGPNTPAK